GRYLPGSVWHLLGRVYLGQRAGVGRGSGALGVVLEQSLQLLGALLLVTLTLPFWPAGSAVRSWAWLAALVPLGFIGIHPALFFPLLNRTLTLIGREPVPPTLRYRTMLGYLTRYLSIHLANGLALGFAVLALGMPLSIIPAVVGAALFAWTVGYLTVLAPGGLGLREWLVTAVLGPLLGLEVAAAGAILWRAANIVTEALGAVGFDLLGRVIGSNGIGKT
ncbi:MAG: lysylphosphatidylglycerol synthase domain-containing protein, partial [Chloroflexota bacterium]|nr:lysylphosphatidylglycerol synthase domain-containing protein [Chloroflexota bacterium]